MWRICTVCIWAGSEVSLISPDEKPCRCCVRRRSPPKNSSTCSRKSSIGCLLHRRHWRSGPPQEGTTVGASLSWNHCPWSCLPPCPQSLQELGLRGWGRDWGEAVSLSVHALLQPQKAEWEPRERKLSLPLHLEADGSPLANVFLKWMELTSR